MEITLNKDKYGMLFLDNLPPLTYDDPGPIAVDVTQLTPTQFQQIKNNLDRGALIADHPEEMLRDLPVPPMPQEPSMAILEPEIVRPKPKEINEALEEQIAEFKKILTGSIPSVKKTIPGLTMAEIRRLKELEEAGKNRKTLVEFLGEAYEAHQIGVVKTVGTSDLEIDNVARNRIVRGGLDLNQYSTNVTDVVESDIEEIIIKTPTDE